MSAPPMRTPLIRAAVVAFSTLTLLLLSLQDSRTQEIGGDEMLNSRQAGLVDGRRQGFREGERATTEAIGATTAASQNQEEESDSGGGC